MTVVVHVYSCNDATRTFKVKDWIYSSDVCAGMLIHSKAKPSKITCKLFQHRWQITRKRALAAKLTSSKG